MKPLFYSIIFLILITSCSTTNDVANGRRIQKRKYNKGFYFKKRKSDKKSNSLKTDLVFVSNNKSIESIEIARPKIATIPKDKITPKTIHKPELIKEEDYGKKSYNKENKVISTSNKNQQKLSTYNYEEDEYRAALYTAKKRVLWAIWGVFIPYVGFFLIPFQLFLGLGAKRIESYICLLTSLAFLGLTMFALITFTANPIIPIVLIVLGLGTIIFNYVILISELMILNKQIRES